jgi:hypothetical protein
MYRAEPGKLSIASSRLQIHIIKRCMTRSVHWARSEEEQGRCRILVRNWSCGAEKRGQLVSTCPQAKGRTGFDGRLTGVDICRQVVRTAVYRTQTSAKLNLLSPCPDKAVRGSCRSEVEHRYKTISFCTEQKHIRCMNGYAEVYSSSSSLPSCLPPSFLMGIFMPWPAKHLLSSVLSMTPGNFLAEKTWNGSEKAVARTGRLPVESFEPPSLVPAPTSKKLILRRKTASVRTDRSCRTNQCPSLP